MRHKCFHKIVHKNKENKNKETSKVKTHWYSDFETSKW